MDWKPILNILTTSYQQALQRLPLLRNVEELRLRIEKPATVLINGNEQALSVRGNSLIVSQGDLSAIVANACGQSVYASVDALAQGYLSLPGGHRLGICGTVVSSGTSVTIRDYSSVNLRIARECAGCADDVISILRSQPGSVLVIGPPGCGKTTLLRDMIRQISDCLNRRVGVADERGEIAAVRNGIPQMNIGMHTDVMTGGNKADCLMRMLRSMNPEYLAMDEISAGCDLDALQHAAYCGVSLIATAHAYDRNDLLTRPVYQMLLQAKLFSYLVTLKQDRTVVIERME